MRIVAGKFRGRKLNMSGRSRKIGVRPTSDMVREAIFSSLQFEFSGNLVCDLYAGTGAMGIEALSRGSRFCTFVEKDAGVAGVLERNLEVFHIPPDSREVFAMPVERFLVRNTRIYDMVFVDPPYEKGLVCETLKRILEAGCVRKSGKIVVEHSSGERIDFKDFEELSVLKEKKYGRTLVSFITV